MVGTGGGMTPRTRLGALGTINYCKTNPPDQATIDALTRLGDTWALVDCAPPATPPPTAPTIFTPRETCLPSVPGAVPDPACIARNLAKEQADIAAQQRANADYLKLLNTPSGSNVVPAAPPSTGSGPIAPVQKNPPVNLSDAAACLAKWEAANPSWATSVWGIASHILAAQTCLLSAAKSAPASAGDTSGSSTSTAPAPAAASLTDLFSGTTTIAGYAVPNLGLAAGVLGGAFMLFGKRR